MIDLLVFDPGPHTGVAWFCKGQLLDSMVMVDDPGVPGALYRYILNAIEPVAGHWHAARSSYPETPRPVVLVESYHTVMALGPNGLATVKLIGWITGQTLLHDLSLVEQMPAVKKPFLLDARQYHPKSDHARDAIAHGLAYLNSRVAVYSRAAGGGAS